MLLVCSSARHSHERRSLIVRPRHSRRHFSGLAVLLQRSRQFVAGLQSQVSAAIKEAEDWRAKEGSEREARIALETRLLHLNKCEADLTASQKEVLRLTQEC